MIEMPLPADQSVKVQSTVSACEWQNSTAQWRIKD
jgi:hypothetical protein